MAKYLDYTGLQYLWTKIKNYVSTQPLGANVRYDVQSLTDAQKEQARQNIAAANTNPNILMNWDFTNPVNSRGQTTYTEGGYRIDKWRVWNAGTTTTLTANGLILSNNTSGDGLFQYLDSKTFTSLYGKTVTISAIVNGTLITASGVASADCWIGYDWTGVVCITYVCNGTEAFFRVQIDANSSVTIKSVKMELGSVSTLSYDSTADYGTELARCIYSPNLLGDTYCGNGFGRSNPNLLDNWYFVGGGSQYGKKLPINQRGVTTYTVSYENIFDRWHIQGSAASTCTITSYGITFTASTENCGLSQTIPSGRIESGAVYTLSVLTTDGVVHSGSRVLTANNTWQNFAIGLNELGFYNPCYVAENGQTNVFIADKNGAAGEASISIAAVKLEKGAVSTLINDAPPDFVDELLKCQMYLRYVPFIRTLIALESTYTIAIKTLEGIEMASYPTATLTQAGTVMQFSPQAWATPTGVSVIAFNHYTPTVQFNLSSTLEGVGYIVDTVICLNCEL